MCYPPPARLLAGASLRRLTDWRSCVPQVPGASGTPCAPPAPAWEQWLLYGASSCLNGKWAGVACPCVQSMMPDMDPGSLHHMVRGPAGTDLVFRFRYLIDSSSALYEGVLSRLFPRRGVPPPAVPWCSSRRRPGGVVACRSESLLSARLLKDGRGDPEASTALPQQSIAAAGL